MESNSSGECGLEVDRVRRIGRGGEDGDLYSTLNLTLPRVFAFTRRSLVEVGRGLVIMGWNGVSVSSKISQIFLESMAGW